MMIIARWASLGDLDYQLIRRVVEIRDGRLALRPHLDGAAARAALVEAAHAELDWWALAAGWIRTDACSSTMDDRVAPICTIK